MNFLVLQFSFTQSSPKAIANPFSVMPDRPFSRSPSVARPGPFGHDDMTKTRGTSVVTSTKKFSTPTPHRIDSTTSLSVDKKSSTKPITLASPNVSLSDPSMLFQSESTHSFTDINRPGPAPTTSRHHIPKLVSDKIASLENIVSNLQRDFNMLALRFRHLLKTISSCSKRIYL
jgi:hypothetical protein